MIEEAVDPALIFGREICPLWCCLEKKGKNVRWGHSKLSVPELCLLLLSRISPASRKLVLVDSIWTDHHQVRDRVAEPMSSTFEVGTWLFLLALRT